MKVSANNEGQGKFELPKGGTQIGRLIKIIDLGTQKIEYKGNQKELQKIKFIFELPLQTRVFKEGEPAAPFRVSKEYTKSLFEKSSLRKDIEAWANRPLTEAEQKEGFDIAKLLGKACQVTVVIKKSSAGKEYAQISNIAPLNKEIKDAKGNIMQHAQICPPTEAELILFDMDEPSTLSVFDKLSKTEKAKIMQSPEWTKLQTGQILNEAGVEDLTEAPTEEDEF